MADRVSRHGWRVLDSIASDDGTWCVDLIEHADGGFGFAEFRADPEDGGRWSLVRSHGAAARWTARDAAEAAVAGLSWLQDDVMRQAWAGLFGESR